MSGRSLGSLMCTNFWGYPVQDLSWHENPDSLSVLVFTWKVGVTNLRF